MKHIKKIYNDQEIDVAQFEATLLSLGTEVKEYQNSAGEQIKFRNSTIEFATDDGEIVRTPAIVYEKSVEHGMVLGEKYLGTSTLNNDGKGVFTTCSHLIYGGNIATPEMFGFDTSKEAITDSVVAKAKAHDSIV